MKLHQLISRVVFHIGIAMLVISILLTAYAFAVPDNPLMRVTALITAVVGFIVAYVLSGKLKTDLIKPSTTIAENLEKLSLDPDSSIDELDTEIDEFKRMHQNTKSLAETVRQAGNRVREIKGDTVNDFNFMESVYDIASSSMEAGKRITSILEKVTDYLSFKNYYHFVKDSGINALKRINQISGEQGDFQRIPLSDSDRDTLVSVYSGTRPQVISGLKTLSTVQSHVRNWAEKNSIDSVYAVPVQISRVPHALLLFSGGAPDELSLEKTTILNLVVEVIGSLYREETRLKETREKFLDTQVENHIYRCVHESAAFEDLCLSFIGALAKYIPVDWGCVAVRDEESGNYVMYSSSLLSDEERSLKKSLLQAEKSGVEWVRQNGKSWIDEDLNLQKPFYEDEMYVFEGLTSRVITPILGGGEFRGAVAIASTKTNTYTKKHVDLLEKITHILNTEVSRSRKTTDLMNEVRDLRKSIDTQEAYCHKLGHELKNPLEKLLRLSETVREKSEGTPEGEIGNYLGEFENKLLQLRNSVEKVVSFHQAEAGRMEFQPDKFFLIEILHGIMAEFQKESERRKVQLKMDIPRGMPEIVGDKEKVRSILRELVGNAFLYTPENGIVTIKSNLIPKSWLNEKAHEFFPKHVLQEMDIRIDQVLLSVVNTCTGLTGEQQENLFKSPRFSEKKTAGASDSLGIGLPLVKELVDLHRGVIWAEDLSGRGARFSFNLPQFGNSWISLRSAVRDRIKRAKRSLISLTAIAIGVKGIEELKMQVSEIRIGRLLREVEDAVKPKLRDHDTVQMVQDTDSVVIISYADRGESRAIKQRIVETLKSLKSKELPDMPELTFVSLTYPDEILDVDELLDKLYANLSESVKSGAAQS